MQYLAVCGGPQRSMFIGQSAYQGLGSSAFLETIGGATLRKLEFGNYFPTLILLVLVNEWAGEKNSMAKI